MNQSEVRDILSADRDGPGEDDSLKLVPVSESIRYRKRAQSAEKRIEDLTEQLAEAKAEAVKTAEELSSIQEEQELMRKLTAAGTVDLETAFIVAKARMEGQDEVDMDGTIEQLRRDKQYLFAGTRGVVTAKKTTGAKERMESNGSILERAAKKAATTGSRTDLQEYLKLRRNFV